MEDYWLVINEENKSIEICFPDRESYLINTLMATFNHQQLLNLKNKLDSTDKNTAPYDLKYE